MARGSFLVKGGKGKIGLGERQITPDEIVNLGLDNSDEVSVLKKQLEGISLFNRLVYNILLYDRVPILVVKEENFSNSTYFNPNPYIILKNEKNEFFFGVDSSKPNSRFNPSGTLIKIETGSFGRTTSIIPTFYCPADERAVYKDSRVTFYKLYPSSPNTINFNFSNALTYGFTAVREDFSKNNDSFDLALIDVPTRANVTADEVKAEVKNGVLYLTVKNALTSDTNTTSFVVCQVPPSYVPSRAINVSLFNQLGESFFGTLDTNGALTVIVNGKTQNGLYLHTSIPVLDTRDQSAPVTNKF
ncbi:hypothetical protein T190611E02C_50183 [Tenacibaculum sp. 190524A05c]|uniref:hypothetical protein n=1 Tax=Tenacibaculum platacis TaxID=3137852 RepID=UPI0031FB70D3